MTIKVGCAGHLLLTSELDASRASETQPQLSSKTPLFLKIHHGAGANLEATVTLTVLSVTLLQLVSELVEFLPAHP